MKIFDFGASMPGSIFEPGNYRKGMTEILDVDGQFV
jgi:hypothetical protein